MRGLFIVSLCCMVCPFGASLVATTWVFGPVVDMREFGSVGLDVFNPENPGFIRLSFDGSVLEIDLVRRPPTWPIDKSFCSAILPAAVVRFFELNPEFSTDQIDIIRALNVARPFQAGCRCYAGLMLAMNARTINGAIITNPKVFCERDYGLRITARFTAYSRRILPQVTGESLAHVRGAQSITRYF